MGKQLIKFCFFFFNFLLSFKGTTDPLLKKFSKGIENIKGRNFFEKSYLEFKFIFTNLKVIAYKYLFYNLNKFECLF